LTVNIWVKELLNNLDKKLDDKSKIAVMEACGESCPFTHLPDARLMEIKNCAKDKNDLLQKLAREWRVNIEDDNIYVVFDKCYCPLVNDNIAGASKTLCYCTQGNIKKKFRLAMDQEIDVLMEKTILAGDNECRFKIVFK